MSDVSDLLAQRYGSGVPEASLDGFDDHPVLPTLLGHKSIRRYKPNPLPPETLEMLGAAAQSAASSSNLQMWSVVAVTDPARKAEASKLCGDQDSIRQAPCFLSSAPTWPA